VQVFGFPKVLYHALMELALGLSPSSIGASQIHPVDAVVSQHISSSYGACAASDGLWAGCNALCPLTGRSPRQCTWSRQQGPRFDF